MDPDDDKDLFRSIYGDIERITDDRVTPWRKKPRRRDVRHCEQSAPPPPLPEISPWPEAGLDPHAGQESMIYQADGIQQKLMRKLCRGQLGYQASLDLHGMTRANALRELQQFIEQCQSRGMNRVHVIHGKGNLSKGGIAVLKPSVASWLRQMPSVLAFCPSRIQDGGDGALYILLKRIYKSADY